MPGSIVLRTRLTDNATFVAQVNWIKLDMCTDGTWEYEIAIVYLEHGTYEVLRCTLTDNEIHNLTSQHVT